MCTNYKESPKQKKINMLIDAKMYEQAMEIITQEIIIGSITAEIFELKGDVHHLLKDDTEAYCSYEKSYEIEKNKNTLAKKLYFAVRENMLIDLDEYHSLDDSHMADLVKGEVAKKEGRYLDAFDHAVQAFDKDDTSVDGLILYMEMGLKKGLTEELYEEVVFKSVNKAPHNDELLRTQINVLLVLKSYVKCEKLCRKIIMKNPDCEVAIYAKEIQRHIKNDTIPEQDLEHLRPQEPQMVECVPSGEQLVLSDQDEIYVYPPMVEIEDEVTHTLSTDNLEQALEKFNELVGLDNIKEQLHTLRKKVEYDKYRKEELGLQDLEDDASYHFVFSGNPGTGKTTIARLFSEVFYHLDILEKGHLVETDRSGLVGEYIGHTATKTQKLIQEAMGGVLFIDEAYALSQGGENDFGLEAIDTLVKGMEDNRKNLIVILAGYKKNMEDFMNSNPGLQSRFTKYVEFQDYTESELLEIAESIADKQKYTLDESAKQAFIETINKQRLGSKFGNARAVRNIMNEAFELKAGQYNRVQMTMEELTTLSAKDFGVDVDELPEQRAEKYLKELKELIGLDSVKDDIETTINLIKYQKEEMERIGIATASMSMHMVFAGNPGTGKTTVARLYGELLREIGVLKKGQFIEVSRADLVASYSGQTAPKVKKACENAFGGILFVDEAYALCNGSQDQFGMEAVNTLIKEMEDHRDKLVVILAGYTGNMEEFLESNPGFASRITKTLEFEDYSVEELVKIFDLYVQKELFTYEEGCKPILKERIQLLIDTTGKNFGNARDVRKLYDAVKLEAIMRVQKNKIEGDSRRKILAVDFK